MHRLSVRYAGHSTHNDKAQRAKGKPMTDMTPEEINRRIAEWVGICPHDSFEYLTPSDFHEGTPLCSQCGVAYGQLDKITDYFHTNAAMDLLGVLVDKKYWYEMSSHADDTHTVAIGEWTGITSEDGNLMWIRKYICEAERKPTIPAAICHAIMEIIEREGE